MRLYLLTNVDVSWDSYDAKLIRAETQKQAREIANQNFGAEGAIWNDKNLVKSTVIANKGNIGEIIASFNAG